MKDRRAAEALRQAEYRRYHLKSEHADSKALHTLINIETSEQLKRITSYYGVTQRKAIESIINW